MSQPNSNTIYPPKGVSQFKAPLRFHSGTSGALQEQIQRSSIQEGTPSRVVSQFKAPLRPQSGTLREQSQPYAAFGAPPFNSALDHVTDPSQLFVQQPEQWREQGGYYPSSGLRFSNTALQHAGPSISLPRVQAFPSVVARGTYFAGDPITQKSNISTDPYIGMPDLHSSLEAHRQGLSPQLLRESSRLWHALPQTEPLVRSEAPRKIKTQVMIKVIFMGGIGLLVGGIASVWLLRFPTYLVVAWAILIIILSNLVSRELRSYYLLKSTKPAVPGMDAGHPSTTSTFHSADDMGRHPELKDISDTTGYLKALNLVFKPGHPAQNFFPEKEYRV
jgi:hypothetical protein